MTVMQLITPSALSCNGFIRFDVQKLNNLQFLGVMNFHNNEPKPTHPLNLQILIQVRSIKLLLFHCQTTYQQQWRRKCFGTAYFDYTADSFTTYPSFERKKKLPVAYGNL